MLNFNSKIYTAKEALAWRSDLSRQGVKLVVTNGCFDLLHLGHVTYLEKARNLGGALLVAINSDSSVRVLKGEGRPINPENDRAGVLAALESVNGVYIFGEVRATSFLHWIRPDIYVKGADYNIETIPQDERQAVEAGGGAIRFIDFVPGRSTTGLVKKISS